MNFRILVAIAFLTLLTVSCAKQQPPPGGPEDKTPPEILFSIPENESVRIDRTPLIEIGFSERMNRDKLRSAVFISPPTETPPELSWKKNSLRITFQDSLDADKTYLITVGSSATDEHNNRIENSFTLALSTGESIDSGFVSGSARSRGKPYGGATVVAWEVSSLDTVGILTAMPEYFTQTGADGSFTFSYMSPGEFILMAFDDRNNNRTWDPSKEMAGLATQPVLLTQQIRSMTGINFDLLSRDTVPLTVKDAAIARSGVLRVSFDGKLLRNGLGKADVRLVSSMSPDTIVVDTLYAWSDTTSSIYARVDLPDGFQEPYILLDSIRDLWGNLVDTKTDTVYVQPALGIDGEAPALIDVEPPSGSINIELRQAFRFRYDEPVLLDSTAPSFSLTAVDSTRVICAGSLEDPFTIVFVPVDSLSPGTKYDGSFLLSSVRDLSGNVPPDSIQSLTYRTVNPDSLGSFSGTVGMEGAVRDKFLKLFYTEVPKGSWKELEVDELGRFHEFVPPAKYRFTGFLDRDGDGFHSGGSLDPFKFAEPMVIVVDTVTVRPRFETEDVILNLE